MFFKKRFSVKPNNIGFLFYKNKFQEQLEPGIYEYVDRKGYYAVCEIPTTNHLINITNQEVLTKDNIALRFSFVVEYKIANPEHFVKQFDILKEHFNIHNAAYQVIHNYCQIYIREAIGKLQSEALNEQKGSLLTEVPEQLQKEVGAYGIEIVKQLLKDVTFPKQIQNMFAKKLEANIKAQTDLQNARTAVATARALKNASEIMKNDENIRFMQYLETMTKIAEKGKHTFVLGGETMMPKK